MYMSWLLEDSLQEQMTQDHFVPHGREDILNIGIGRLEHPGLGFLERERSKFQRVLRDCAV